MLACRARKTADRLRKEESGQAMLEFAVSVLMLATFLFGVVDFSRAIYQQQEITSLAAQGANLALRGGDLGATATLLASQSSNLALSNNGKIIVSAVQNQNNTMRITDQQSTGAALVSSKVGLKGGVANIPSSAIPPITMQTVYVTEIYMTYRPITPVGKLMGGIIPTQLYDVAYY
jgi:Flp pilus assembly protein TadG